jgi:AraC-like DNA-binding protein
MLTTSLILPQPALSDFIKHYTLCQSESANLHLSSPWFAHHDISLCFFLGDTPIQIKSAGIENASQSIYPVCLFGLLTQSEGNIEFKGRYNQFIIEFKPNGFNKLFGIPASEISNGYFSANEVIGNNVNHFYEQLLHASGVQQMAALAEQFLLNFLYRQKAVYRNEGISRISHLLLTDFTSTKIAQYANEANMSLRNFERRFAEQVGTSPKLFCRLLRFDAAVQSKINHPEKSWTEIAYECGYFDSMHMIKEFKQFANASPATLFNHNPVFMEETVTTVERLTL